MMKWQAAALFLAVTIVAGALLLPYSAHPATATIDRCDSLLNVWILAWVQHTITSAPLQLYNGNIFYPEPYTIAYSENMLPLALLLLPLRLLFSNPILIHNIAVLLSFPLSAVGMFFLARSFGFSSYGAWLAAWIFTFTPMKFEELARVQVLSSQWMPLALLFCHRYFKRGGMANILLLALFSICQTLTSYYHGMFTVVLIVVYTATRYCHPAWRPSWKKLTGLFAAALMALAVLIPVSRPYFILHHTVSFSRPLSEVCKYSADLTAFVNYSTPFGRIGFANAGTALFPGILITGLALFTLHRRFKSNPVHCFAWLLIVVAIILSLGPELIVNGTGTGIPLPAQWIWQWIPGFKAFRILWRASILVTLGLALLAAAAWDHLQPRSPRTRAWLLIAFLLFNTLEISRWPIRYFQWPEPDQYPQYTQFIRDNPTVTAYAEAPLEQFHNLKAMLFSTSHFKPMLNGFSGFEPLNYHRAKWFMERFPTPAGIRYLQNRGITHAVIHTQEIHRFHERNPRAECAAFPELTLCAEFPETLIYRIAPFNGN